MHDALQFEAEGIPAALIMTDPFQGLAAEFAESLGAPGYPAVMLPHPVSTLDHQALDRLADRAYEVVLGRFQV